MVQGYIGRILEIKENAVLVGKYYIVTSMRIALAPEVSKHMRANSDCLCHFNWCKLVTYRHHNFGHTLQVRFIFGWNPHVATSLQHFRNDITKAPAKNTGVTIQIFMLHFKHL